MESLSSRSEYSELLPLDARFILENARVSWQEILWAYEMGIVGWRTLKELAQTQQTQLQTAPFSEELSQLATLVKEQAGMTVDFARSLAANGVASDPGDVQKKWLYLLLTKLYENKSHMTDPYGVVEQIYADFEYPEELVGFVRWMPSAEPARTPEEGEAKMDRRWRMYLQKCAAEFGSNDGHSPVRVPDQPE